MEHPVISLTKELLGEKDVVREGFTVSVVPMDRAVTRL